jgi:type I restriction enzyme S subunit
MVAQWKISTLAQEFLCIDGDRGPNYPKKEEYKPNGYCLFLSTKNVREYGFDFSEKVFIGKERHEKLRNGTLVRGDLVLTTRGTLGYVASYDESVPFDVVRINSGMLILRKRNPTHNNEFFKMFIASPVFQRIIDEQRTGSAQPQLPAKILKEFELQIPTPGEQTEIVRRVEQLFAFADTIEQKTNTALARVNNLTQSILAKAFRGELTAGWRAANPDLISGENSAAALLERIKAERAENVGRKRR